MSDPHLVPCDCENPFCEGSKTRTQEEIAAVARHKAHLKAIRDQVAATWTDPATAETFSKDVEEARQRVLMLGGDEVFPELHVVKDDGLNPKDRAALDRVPLHLLPGVGRIYGAAGCLDGAIKYGPYNWRDKAISYMGYTSALERHILAIRDGEDVAPDSQVHHLGHIIATASILLDAMQVGKLIDDRPGVDGSASALMNEFKSGEWPGLGLRSHQRPEGK